VEGSVSKLEVAPPRMARTRSWLGVRGRLLLAFFGISALAALGAAAALYSFREIDGVLALITQRRIPVAVQSQELSRHAERIAAAAPGLLTAASQIEKEQWWRHIDIEVSTLIELLAQLRNAGVENTALQSLEPAVDRLRANLRDLNLLVNDRLVIADQKKDLLHNAINVATEVQALLAPWVSVIDERIAQWRHLARDSSVPDQRRSAIDREFEMSLAWSKALQASEVTASSISDLLQRAAAADDASTAAISGFRLQQALGELARLADQLDPKLRSLMLETLDKLGLFVVGGDSVPALRRRELALTNSGSQLLSENAELSKKLTATVDSLVANARADINDAHADALSLAHLSAWVLIIAVVLSLVSSALIVWFYVGRNIIKRLTDLSASMLAIAGGRLSTPAVVSGNDEITAMGHAVEFFRQNAIQLEQLLAEREQQATRLEQQVAERTREIDVARARLTDAIESMSDGFALWDKDDKLVTFNNRSQQLLHLSDLFVPGMRFEDLISTLAFDRDHYKVSNAASEALYARRLALHRNVPSEHEQQLADGTWLRVGEYRTQEGGTVSIWTDITTLKRREAELADTVRHLEIARDQATEASRIKSRFVASMSHELRTPLNAVIGITEMLQEDAQELGHHEFLEPLERASRAGRHLLHLINDVLDLSKIEAGKLDLHLDDVEVHKLLLDAVNTAAPLAEKNHNQLLLDCPDDLGILRTDTMRLRQILLNLVSNACKFTEQGKVSVSAAREVSKRDDQSWLRLSVADTGIGMTAEQVGRLFQEFSQADSSTTRKYGGTGLGLAISQRLCQLLGGDISVTSEPGVGTEFTVRLPFATPLTMQAHLAEPAPARPILTTLQRTSNTILVIDDDATVRDLMRRFLAREGFDVVTAAGGAEGLRLAREINPCVITLDVVMPPPDGWSVLQQLQADPQLAGIPVIVLTILDDENKGYSLGASDYLTKPIDRARLAAVLGKYRTSDPHRQVLLVEDDADTRLLLRQMLAKDGWRVSEAENGRVALDRLGEVAPVLIVLDLMMPEMDGFEFLAERNKSERWRRIPVVVITAADLSDEDHARLNGAVERILIKASYGRDELLQEVRAIVERHALKATVEELQWR
jgi:adenylate cyclase